MIKLIFNDIAILVIGMMLVIGGLSRYHHHSTDNSICFCHDCKVDPICNHHHDIYGHQSVCHDAPLEGHTSDASCAFHIDDFKISNDDSYTTISDNTSSKILYAAFLYCVMTHTPGISCIHFITDETKAFKTRTLDDIISRGPPVC